MMKRMTMKTWLALDEDQQAVWWLWVDLQCWLRYQCEMLVDTEHFESSLPPLPPASALLYENATRSTCEMIILFCCGASDYRMRVVYDSGLLSIRYRIDGAPRLHEVLGIVRNGTARFETPDGFLLVFCSGPKLDRVILATSVSSKTNITEESQLSKPATCRCRVLR
jgi:hypothetical protein